jgi:hypothetical protein
MLTMMRAGIFVGMLAIALAACTSGRGSAASSDAAYAADAEGQDAAIFACASLVDCQSHFPGGPYVFCCIDNACVYGPSAEAIPCADASAQLIKASNYDQSLPDRFGLHRSA